MMVLARYVNGMLKQQGSKYTQFILIALVEQHRTAKTPVKVFSLRPYCIHQLLQDILPDYILPPIFYNRRPLKTRNTVQLHPIQ
jgi:hypothetical protein